jgi:hypothetical protein
MPIASVCEWPDANSEGLPSEPPLFNRTSIVLTQRRMLPAGSADADQPGTPARASVEAANENAAADRSAIRQDESSARTRSVAIPSSATANTTCICLALLRLLSP